MVRERIEELRRQLELHNFKYYVENAPEISSFEFDAMMRELQELERAHPEFADPNSPSVRVGSDLAAEFQTVRHRYPMLSLGNTYSLDELNEFIARIERETGPTNYVCELKFDGTAISLTYEHGRLVRAVTRGDGVQGDDVTANVRTVRTVPLRLRGEGWPDHFEIRGEILMPYASFDRLERRARGQRRTALRQPPQRRRRNAQAAVVGRGGPARTGLHALPAGGRRTACSRPTGRAWKRPANGASRSRMRRASAAAPRRSTHSSNIGTRRGANSPSRRTAW